MLSWPLWIADWLQHSPTFVALTAPLRFAWMLLTAKGAYEVVIDIHGPMGIAYFAGAWGIYAATLVIFGFFVSGGQVLTP